MKERYYLEVGAINGGIRNDFPDSSMPDAAWESLVNWEYDRGGNLVSRGGMSSFNATAISCTTIDNGIRFYRESTASLTTIVTVNATGGNVAYVANDSTGVMTAVTGGTVFSASIPINMTVFRSNVFFHNGTDTMSYFQTGSARANCVFSDNDIKGKYACIADNRMWVAGHLTNKNRVYVSGDGLFVTAPSADCSFPTNNYVDIPTQANDRITGLVEWADDVFVFRFKDIHRVTGSDADTWGMVGVFSKIGAVDQRAICKTPYGIAFADEWTLWWWVPGSDPVNLGRRISTVMESAILDNCRISYRANVNKVYFTFYDGTSGNINNYAAVYDIEHDALTLDSRGWAGYIDYNGIGDTANFYGLSAATSGATLGKMYWLGVTDQDNGANYDCTALSKHFELEDPNTVKMMRAIWMNMKALTDTTPVALSAIIDKDASIISLGTYYVSGLNYYGEFILGEAYYGGGDYQHVGVHFPSFIQGHTIQIKMVKSDSNAFILYNWKCEYKKRKLRRQI